jgi:hypothetical protein
MAWEFSRPDICSNRRVGEGGGVFGRVRFTWPTKGGIQAALVAVNTAITQPRDVTPTTECKRLWQYRSRQTEFQKSHPDRTGFFGDRPPSSYFLQSIRSRPPKAKAFHFDLLSRSQRSPFRPVPQSGVSKTSHTASQHRPKNTPSERLVESDDVLGFGCWCAILIRFVRQGSIESGTS